MTDRQPPAGKGYDLQREYTDGVEDFWFRWADQWWVLPHRKMLDYAKLLRVAQLQDVFADVATISADDVTRMLNDVFAMLMGEQQGAEFAEVDRPIEFLVDTLNRWRAHSGEAEEEQGESSASTSSSASTGRPSKRTSSGSSTSGSRKPSTPRARKTATARASSSSTSAG